MDTACDLAAGYTIEFLDRHVIDCGSGQAIQKWHMVDCDGINSRFTYTCALLAPPFYYFCTEGSGGTCYEASTSCFGSCPNMANWKAPAYDSSYASFQTYCASWSANSGTFNGRC